MEITRGRVNRAQRVTIYGPEGIGKSTLASLFPNPVFMDVEQGTHEMDVARTPAPASFEMIRQITTDLRNNPQGYQTFVVDTADWTQRYAITEVCSSNNMGSLGGEKDYGRSYNLLEEKWAKWLDSLTEICMGLGMHIVVLAHAMMRKFEQPEEVGAFDRWEMKLEKKVSAKQKEWSDLLLFFGYKTLVIEGERKTKKGTGGARVLRTSHHPCWDAKNRHGLPGEILVGPEHTTALPTELYNIFYSAVPGIPQPTPQQDTYRGVPVVNKSPMDDGKEETVVAPMHMADSPLATPQPTQKIIPGSQGVIDDLNALVAEAPASEPAAPPLPANLLQLMEKDDVTELDIRRAVAQRGHYPVETPITNYDPKFIDGVLVAAWDKVKEIINGLTEGAEA